MHALQALWLDPRMTDMQDDAVQHGRCTPRLASVDRLTTLPPAPAPAVLTITRASGIAQSAQCLLCVRSFTSQVPERGRPVQAHRFGLLELTLTSCRRLLSAPPSQPLEVLGRTLLSRPLTPRFRNVCETAAHTCLRPLKTGVYRPTRTPSFDLTSAGFRTTSGPASPYHSQHGPGTMH